MKEYIDKLYSFIIVTLSCIAFIASGILIVYSIINMDSAHVWQALGCVVIGIVTSIFYLHMSRLGGGEKDNPPR